MKILFLCHYFHPRIGGVEKHVYKVAKELIKNKHTVTLITSRYDKSLPQKEIVDGIKIVRLSLGKGSWQKPGKTELWKQILSRKKIFEEADIVHCHDVFFWYLLLRFLLPFKPVYITFHGYEQQFPPSKKAIFIRKLSEKLAWGNICIGEYIEKWYGTQATEVIYGASEIPEKTRNYTNKLSALYLGRIDADNYVQTYCGAVELLKKHGIKLKVEFCGKGKLENIAEKYGRLLDAREDITTPLFRNRFAFVSSYLSILEAMAHKRFIFSVYGNALKRDYLVMSPFKSYVNISSNAQELADQIEFFIKSPEKEAEIVEKAYQWVKTQNWEALTDQYLKLWKH